jgi:hypothetical protein
MEMQATTLPANSERKIISILRRLPTERGLQLLAFARFLAMETFQTQELSFLENELENELERAENDTQADAQWDALFASEEGQLTLDRLADDTIYWFWIGDHDEYKRIIKSA